jgi:hypothetical protein
MQTHMKIIILRVISRAALQWDLRLSTIVDPSITPAPPLIATRAMAVSQFSGDPAGTLYVGRI